LAWLHASQSPWAFSADVAPPWAARMTWSMCRIGASHQECRQVWSRQIRNWRSSPSKTRRRESIATRALLDGLV
jgi:hypothetical protein